MYSVLDYSSMIRDRVRMDAYIRALSRVIAPSSVVVDLGAGTGILSLIAARAGAQSVHAVESNPAIHLLTEIARENGLEDRIHVHASNAFDFELAGKADVLVSDLRGAFPLHGDHLAIIRDCRGRLLRDGGRLLPQRDRFHVALFESDELLRRLDRAADGFQRHGFAAVAARTSVFNSVYRDEALATVLASDVVSTSAEWGGVDYRTWAGGIVEGEVALVGTRASIAHGLVVWFEASVTDDITYSNAPGTAMAYARTILPFVQPLEVPFGGRVSVALRVDERGERWAWECSVGAKQRRQTTFFGVPTSPEALLRESSAYRPTRAPSGDRLAAILGGMDGTATVAQIAGRIAEGAPGTHPERVLAEVHDAVTRWAR